MKQLFPLIFLLLLSCTIQQQNLPPFYSNLTLPHANTSLEAIRERVLQSETGFTLFSAEEDSLWVQAYITSSDHGGNFYKELYLQDQAEMPQFGLRFLIDRTALSDFFLPGKKLAILLNGLGAGFKNGVLTLGEYQGNDIGEMAGFLFDQHIRISDSITPILPKELDLSQVDETQIGQWVKFSNVQFTRASLGKTFSGEEMDQFDGERRLVQCSDQRSLLMSTSTFADFKSILLPEGGGEIQGILTKDFFGEKPILKINSPRDISFEHSRCDPFFEENFEEVRLGLFEKEGWFNVNQSGSQFWEVYEDENSLGQSIAIGSYRSGDATTISYLITPVIDVSSLSNPFLAFRSSTRFADNSLLEVFYTTEWEGEVAFIEEYLKELPVRLASNDDDSTQWIDSGDIPIDFGPRFRLIFRYTGGGKSAIDGTYELDDIRVFTKE